MEDERGLQWRSQLQGQSGVVSRQQARDAGWPEGTVDTRLRSGIWQRLYRGTYATFTGDLSREAKLWAAVLWAGPEVALSHETAAEIHGLIDKPIGPIHVSVPAERHPGRRRKIRGVVIHRSRCLVPEWQPPWRLPRTTVDDTVLDLIAKARTFDDAYAWISRAIGRRLTSPQSLSKALARRSRMRWRAWITAALQDAADGVHSPLERNYVYGVERAHGLPTARRQAKRRHSSGTRYLDNLYEEYDLCVELDGLAAHPAEGRWRDTRRDNANRVQGTETLRYGWPDTTENRCRTAAEIAAVLRRRGWKGVPRPCGPACPVGRGPEPG
ncbi:MAG TPA: type IV toxin-antitoxin system AbiEi family antitoxin domain-containing protein [Streptosporangiaceae bacterium]|nr:type IV toxin-antitoxin system AbiEi family antitoxin domain-containing protein [Streptosporangiaceae bacterium]